VDDWEECQDFTFICPGWQSSVSRLCAFPIIMMSFEGKRETTKREQLDNWVWRKELTRPVDIFESMSLSSTFEREVYPLNLSSVI
jgi:hypothetical protein